MRAPIKRPRNIAVAAVIILALAAGGYFYFGREKKTALEFTAARRSDIVQEVSVTGQVKPARSVELAFEKAGKVSAVFADVGDTVAAGQVIVALENSEIAAQVAQAEAALASAKAQLLQKNIAYENGKKNLVDKLNDAYTKADDAVRNKVDQFFSNARGSSPNINFTITDSQLKSVIESGRASSEQTLVAWKASLDALSTASDIDSYTAGAKKNLSEIASFLNNVTLSLSPLTPSSTITQTTINTWRADISTARTNVNTAINNITSANQSAETAEADITLQEAKIKEAEADIVYYRAGLAKTTLLAPINGVVTKQEAKNGEIVSADSPIVSLISAAQFEIEANVPEADIAKVKISNAAKVTLDAYGADVVFAAKVSKIDPAETIIDGVATYKTTFQFVKPDERIKSGMTANIDILTEERKGVLVIPQRAVSTKDGHKFVRIVEGETQREIGVETGLRGSDGNIEILNGLKEGDKVITSLE
ncbi:MAG: efflux RND transporter periplasmic adaptor subunit [Candidatus Sungiibacteriota bacterium]